MFGRFGSPIKEGCDFEKCILGIISRLQSWKILWRVSKNGDNVLCGLSEEIFCGNGRKWDVMRIKGDSVRNSLLSASYHETPDTSVMLNRRPYVPTIKAVETP